MKIHGSPSHSRFDKPFEGTKSQGRGNVCKSRAPVPVFIVLTNEAGFSLKDTTLYPTGSAKKDLRQDFVSKAVAEAQKEGGYILGAAGMGESIVGVTGFTAGTFPPGAAGFPGMGDSMVGAIGFTSGMDVVAVAPGDVGDGGGAVDC